MTSQRPRTSQFTWFPVQLQPEKGRLLHLEEESMVISLPTWMQLGFPEGGVLHITINVGDGASEGSFDLYSQGARLPSEGFPNALAGAHNVRSGASAKIDYRFEHGSMFRLAAEGSWNSKPRDTNTYSFVVDVGNP